MVTETRSAEHRVTQTGAHVTPRAKGVATVWIIALLSTISAWVVAARSGADSLLAGTLTPADFGGSLYWLTMATFGALVVLRGESVRYGWLMLSFGGVTCLITLAGHYALFAWETGAPMVAVAIWVQDLFTIGVLLGLLLLPALFPDGQAASPRWRAPIKVTTVGWILYAIYFAFADRPSESMMYAVDEAIRPSNPLGALPASELTIVLPWVLLLVATFAIAIGSLVARWRHAPNVETRQQVKWVGFAFAVWIGLTAIGNLVFPVLEDGFGVDVGILGPYNVVLALALVGLAVAWGLGVLRFRLHAVDLVINRTIVYSLLTVIVTGVYVLFVVVIGSVLPVEESGLALIATGVVAVGFAPVRSWVQGGVNRMMFGQRDDPSAVMSELGRLMSEAVTPEDTLQTLVRTVAESLKLPGAVIELEQDGNWEVEASYGTMRGDWSQVVVALRDQGDLVGRLVASPRSPHESPSDGDMSLLADIAGPAAAVARSVRLTRALRASRERLVLAREEERRRIRRDLHDGLGPSLAAQTFQLDEILETLHGDPERAAELAESLKSHNQQLISDVRRLVYELRPPALDELGLTGALEAHVAQLDGTRGLEIELSTDPDPLPSVSAAVEVAVFHVVREAITNVTRYADATRCVAKLTASGSTLLVSVEDDGRGITEDDPPGVGLSSMRERTEELGGSFAIRNSSGTEVVAIFPLKGGGSHG